MNIVICEDEKEFAMRLSDEIERFFSQKEMPINISRYENGNDLLNEKNAGFDLIFLDINLGSGDDGINTAHLLRDNGITAPVIFVTALENRAIDGYDVDAYGFVVKKNLSEKLPQILSKLWQEHFCRKTIAISEKNSTELINTDTILSVQSDGRASAVMTEGGRLNDIRPIGKIAEFLGDDFIETHKAIFVNIAKIRRINSDTVTLCDDSAVPLSRRNRKSVMLAVMKRLGEK